MDSSGGTRARWFAEELLEESRNELMNAVGRNFEYLLDNVEAWENGDFNYTDMPELEKIDKWLINLCTLFGVRWPLARNSSLFLVSDVEGSFVGAYGHEDNAIERAESIGGTVEEETEIESTGVEPLIDGLGDEGAHKAVKDNLEFLLENTDRFVSGEVSPDDFPQFDENVKWMMGYSVVFGTLWEKSHPSLFGAFTDEDEFVAVYSSEKLARENKRRGMYVQRLSVADGEKDTEDLLGSMLTGT